MSILLKGKKVADEMKEKLSAECAGLKEKGICPTLGVIRVGQREDDLSYERGAVKRLDGIGLQTKVYEYPQDISQTDFVSAFKKVNDDPNIHGILMFRPLPKQLNEDEIKQIINPVKDIDCMSPVNLAKVFAGDETGFPPCTPQGVMEMLDSYDIDVKGKNVVIVGRSLVVGKPLAMLMLKKHATVTICHTKTQNIQEVCKKADILVAAAGKAKMITTDYVTPQSIVVDVGINVDDAGNLCGDVDFANVEPVVSAISPVPGGAGTVTTSVLAKHVLRSATYLS